MIVANSSSYDVYKSIGSQTYYDWKEYKELPYICKRKVDDGELWYNLLTREILMLRDAEISGLESGNETMFSRMVRKWYYIPKDINPKSIVYSVQQAYLSRNPTPRSHQLNLATIFTTTECNARCPYCYEYGTEKNTMSMETAESVAKFIVNNAMDNMTIKWFGGEPLLNTGVMDLICNKLGEAGIEYVGYMVTNAYLLDKVTDDQIKKLWRINQAQITIDGTKDVYLQTKRLPDDGYEKVLSACERLAKLGVSVNIRTHIKRDNLEDICNMAVEMEDRFSALGNAIGYLHLYVAPLFEGLGEDPNILTDEDRHIIYQNYIAAEEKIGSLKIRYRNGVQGLQRAHCMADSGTGIVITPTGSLTPCEHCHDKEIVGDVWQGGSIPSKWKEAAPEIPECETCFYYPQCNRLKLCDAESPCSEDYREYMRHKQEETANTAYKQFLTSVKGARRNAATNNRPRDRRSR